MVGRGNDRASASQPERSGGGAKRDQSPKYEDDWISKKRIPRHYLINQGRTQLSIIQGDITKIEVDAIVNAANEHMTGGGGIDGVIHRAAGPRLLDECYLHRQVTRGVRLPTGRSRILFSYNLSKKTSYIINTAGPVYNSRARDTCAEELSSCYRTAMALANLYDLKSVAFPAISCGIFGYPADDGAGEALRVADQDAGQLTNVMFILWDDHIYDAWVKKAKELKLQPLTETKAAAASSTEKDKSQTKEKSRERDDHGLSANNQFASTKVVEVDPPDSPAADPDPKGQDMVVSLPSVPSAESDTQKTAEMEGDHTNTDDQNDNTAALDKQKNSSVEMRDVDSDSPNTMPMTESEPIAEHGQGVQGEEVPFQAPRKSSTSLVKDSE